MGFICFNGQFLPADQPIIAAADPGFRYGEGLFETMKMLQGEVLLFSLHCQRLAQGISLLGMEPLPFDTRKIQDWIKTLAQENGCFERGRIRWAVFRQQDGTSGFVLEAFPLDAEAFMWQERGWRLGVYTENRKAAGPLSNLKSSNYLLYLLAAADAKKQDLDECLVLNDHGHLCDGSRTNIFIYKEGMLQTPALSSGCVAGVMRRQVLQYCAATKLPVAEKALTPSDLETADEVFLTNAIQGIRWVSHFKEHAYGSAFSRKLYAELLERP